MSDLAGNVRTEDTEISHDLRLGRGQYRRNLDESRDQDQSNPCYIIANPSS